MVAGSPAIKPVNLRSPALSIFSKAKPRSCIRAFTAAADEPHGMSANAMSLLPLAAAFGSASNAQVNANALIMTSLSDLTPQRKNTPNAMADAAHAESGEKPARVVFFRGRARRSDEEQTELAQDA